MTIAPSWKQLLRYVIPAASAMVLFSLYTVIDGVLVSHGVSESALTSVNISLPFINALSGLSILLSMGASTLCAFALGRGNKKEAEEIFTQTVAVMCVLSVLITVGVLLFAEELATLLGAGPHTIDNAVDYLRIVSLFSICFILSYCLEVMVKVDDSPILATAGVAVSAVVHVGLAYVFIFHFHWGVKGGALATGLAQLGSLLLFLHYFLKGKSDMKFRKFKFHPKIFLRILPLGVADCSIEFMLGFLTIIYNNVLFRLFGESHQTIYAVIAYLSLVVFMIMQGIAQGMMPLVSLAVGKGDQKTIRFYFTRSLLMAAAVEVLLVAVCQLFPQVFVTILLSHDSPLFAQAVSALRQYSLSYLLAGLNILLAGYFTALGRGVASCLLSLSRGFVLLPASIFLLSQVGSGQGIWIAALIGEGLSLLLGLVLLKKTHGAPAALPEADCDHKVAAA
ncbi:MAG: MATE family efflux transporter [Clostridiales bacterium]|nr:MATE family efflux transporter [Clostridiales bacterium]MDY4171369.1 MATE family efflux transporter [Evtepia sp.]